MRFLFMLLIGLLLLSATCAMKVRREHKRRNTVIKDIYISREIQCNFSNPVNLYLLERSITSPVHWWTPEDKSENFHFLIFHLLSQVFQKENLDPFLLHTRSTIFVKWPTFYVTTLQEEHIILTNLGKINISRLKFTMGVYGIHVFFLIFQVCKKNCNVYNHFVGG